jgi:hypothetical protein
MAGTANEVIQTGDIVVWYKTYATGAALPADTVEWGEAWSGFTDLGYTDGGVGLNAGAQYGEVRVDQKRDPLFRPFQSRTLEITMQAAQLAPATILPASGMGAVSTLAPSATARGHNDWTVGDDSGTPFRSWGYDLLQFNGEASRIFVFKGQATGNVNPTISRTQKGLVAAQITALLDDTFDPPKALTFREILAMTA